MQVQHTRGEFYSSLNESPSEKEGKCNLSNGTREYQGIPQ